MCNRAVVGRLGMWAYPLSYICSQGSFQKLKDNHEMCVIRNLLALMRMVLRALLLVGIIRFQLMGGF